MTASYRWPDSPEALDAFDAATRANAMKRLLEAIPADAPGNADDRFAPVNLHVHTFHSFNVRGWSPVHAVYEARRAGWSVVGTVDFDVLHALRETLEAGEAFRQRAVVSLETRVYHAEYADRVINSPGEPGVAYFCVAGFAAPPPEGTPAWNTLMELAVRAEKRNRDVCARVNAAAPEMAVDYDGDVLPLTPSGNATERHLLAAYDARTRSVFGDDSAPTGKRAGFWARTLGVSTDESARLLEDPAKLRTAMRAKLMKQGGPGYVPPTPSAFPPIEEVVAMAKACGALPCAAWLDGGSAGEADAERLVGDYVRLGVRAFCIIPDRNWNIADPAVKMKKMDALSAVVAAAKRHGLIFAVGTEMNNYGQRTVDAFDAPELAPYGEDFRDGAFALYGHTQMHLAREAGVGSAWARDAFGDDRNAENAFYAALGRALTPGKDACRRLAEAPRNASPGELLAL